MPKVNNRPKAKIRPIWSPCFSTPNTWVTMGSALTWHMYWPESFCFTSFIVRVLEWK
jgi:hypothetical protein